MDGQQLLDYTKRHEGDDDEAEGTESHEAGGNEEVLLAMESMNTCRKMNF